MLGDFVNDIKGIQRNREFSVFWTKIPFTEKTVVDLPVIRKALGEVSVQTVFRHLKLIPYRRSYNHNGRYYALYDASRFDRTGLWSFGGIHFSVDGSLRNTVRRLVHTAPAGATHRELQLQLQLRVHNTVP